MKISAIIPARAGSKRLPNKNVRCFCGRPLIEVTLDQALESGVFNGGVYVTTDIESVINDYGDGVILRPPLLANDTATSEDVILHAIWSLPNTPDAFVVLQPTSPLRLKKHFIEIAKILNITKNIVSYAFGGKRNGAFYAAQTSSFLDSRKLKDSPHLQYFMPDWTGTYIDTEEEFVACEQLYKHYVLGE